MECLFSISIIHLRPIHEFQLFLSAFTMLSIANYKIIPSINGWPILFFALLSICEHSAPSMAGTIVALHNLSTLAEKQHSAEQEYSKNSSMGMGTKIFRLKELMAEVKALASEIKEERKRMRKERLKNAGKSTANEKLSPINHQMRRWRKKMHKKLQRISDRLKEIEEKMREQKKEMRQLIMAQKGEKNDEGHLMVESGEKGNGRKNRGGKRKKQSHLYFSSSTLAPNDGNVMKVQIQQRRGQEGYACSHHGNCSPGHCCQRDATKTDEKAKCVLFNHEEGAFCEHSCACSAQLQCFRKKETPEDQPKIKPICKKAMATDLLSGHYVNAEHSIFDSANPPSKSEPNVENKPFRKSN